MNPRSNHHHQLKQVFIDGQTWGRIHRVPRETLYCPTASDLAPIYMFTAQRITEPSMDGPSPNLIIHDDWTIEKDKTLGYLWTGKTTFTVANVEAPPDDADTNFIPSPATTTAAPLSSGQQPPSLEPPDNHEIPPQPPATDE